MRAFSKQPTATVKLQRGDEVIEFTLSPLPLGYQEFLATVYPAPRVFENLKPVDAPREVLSQYQARFNLVCLAKSLGSQVEAQPPQSSERAAWDGYARAVEAEMQAANFIDADLVKLLTELNKLQRGISSPKAEASPASS